jgi:hypothetical protein
MLNPPLVPKHFNVPDSVETPHFWLKMLTIQDFAKDYEAVLSSAERLSTVFGENSDWPGNLTEQQELIDLGWHQKEFQMRTSFAYTVVNSDQSLCLGCVYIFPSPKVTFEAVVFLWVRDSAYKDGLDEVLYRFVKNWIEETWPFKAVTYPGRDIAWEVWNQLLENS